MSERERETAYRRVTRPPPPQVASHVPEMLTARNAAAVLCGERDELFFVVAARRRCLACCGDELLATFAERHCQGWFGACLPPCVAASRHGAQSGRGWVEKAEKYPACGQAEPSTRAREVERRAVRECALARGDGEEAAGSSRSTGLIV